MAKIKKIKKKVEELAPTPIETPKVEAPTPMVYTQPTATPKPKKRVALAIG